MNIVISLEQVSLFIYKLFSLFIIISSVDGSYIYIIIGSVFGGTVAIVTVLVIIFFIVTLIRRRKKTKLSEF